MLSIESTEMVQRSKIQAKIRGVN